MSFPLLPDDRLTTPQDDLEAAVAGALAIPTAPAPVAPAPPEPFGMSWLFDFAAGRFVHEGGAPAVTTELDTLAQWCEMAIHTARFAHPRAVSDQFGMEEPEEPLGEVVTGEILADFTRNLIDALMVHDRVTSVENVALSFDASTGTLLIDSLDVITDEDHTMTVANVAVLTGGNE